jgi:hypothetical protein
VTSSIRQLSLRVFRVALVSCAVLAGGFLFSTQLATRFPVTPTGGTGNRAIQTWPTRLIYRVLLDLSRRLLERVAGLALCTWAGRLLACRTDAQAREVSERPRRYEIAS